MLAACRRVCAIIEIRSSSSKVLMSASRKSCSIGLMAAPERNSRRRCRAFDNTSIELRFISRRALMSGTLLGLAIVHLSLFRASGLFFATYRLLARLEWSDFRLQRIRPGFFLRGVIFDHLGRVSQTR